MKTCFSNIYNQDFASATGESVRITRIVVPKIQRAYAQGRKSELYIRNNFLTDIFRHLVEGNEMDLNFIYGAIRKMESTMAFELIDGQQRMTTLFLLHWYIANRELEHDSEEYQRTSDVLARFSYETRVTSTDFCQLLASFRGDIASLYPSKALKLSKWYFKAYDKDATVECMLVMLDAIHEKYEAELSHNENLSLFGNLDKLQFQVLSLGEFGLTEELYIKMNSRGLPLSSFDNFKAELTGYLRSIPVGNEQVLLTNSYNSYGPFYLDFSTNLDTNWINVFWSKEEPEFDAKYFKFFHMYLGYKYLLEPVDTTTDMRKDPTVKFFLSEDNYSEKYKGFSMYKWIFDVHPEYFKGISKVLTTFSGKYKTDILPNVNPCWESNKLIDSFFNKTTHNVNLAFFATTEFIEAYKVFDLTTYKQWMRVAWNIIENSETDNFMTIAGVARNLSRIIRYAASCSGYSLYDAIAFYGEEDSAKLTSKAIKEEVVKATRISDDQEWEDVFIEAEKHPFLKGTTSFFYSDGISKESFRHRTGILNEILNENGTTTTFKAEGHILLRALISKVSTWKEIMDCYLTDKNESHRFFKHWLINTTSIHDFMCEILDCNDVESALDKLRISVNLDSPITDPMQKRIHKTLYTNGNLQNWLQDHDAIRLRFFKDNIYMMKPNSSIYKVMLDTDRNRFVPDIVNNFYYKYVDDNQKLFWDSTKYYFGNELVLYKHTTEADITINFTTESCLYIDVKPTSEYRKTIFLEKFNMPADSIVDGQLRIADGFNYGVTDAYNEIKRLYLDVIEAVLNE